MEIRLLKSEFDAVEYALRELEETNADIKPYPRQYIIDHIKGLRRIIYKASRNQQEKELQKAKDKLWAEHNRQRLNTTNNN